jgi:hypothetical protein
VTSGIGNGCVWIGWLLFFRYCLVVGKDASEDEEWDEEVEKIIYMYSSKAMN